MTDTNKIASLDEARLAYIDREDFLAQVKHLDRASDEELGAEFDRMIDKSNRESAEAAWDKAAGWLVENFFELQLSTVDAASLEHELLRNNPHRKDRA